MCVINVRLSRRQALPNLDDVKDLVLRGTGIDPADVEIESEPVEHGFFIMPKDFDDVDAVSDFDDMAEQIEAACRSLGYQTGSSLMAA